MSYACLLDQLQDGSVPGVEPLQDHIREDVGSMEVDEMVGVDPSLVGGITADDLLQVNEISINNPFGVVNNIELAVAKRSQTNHTKNLKVSFCF